MARAELRHEPHVAAVPIASRSLVGSGLFGVFISLAFSAVLLALGAAIGLAAFQPADQTVGEGGLWYTALWTAGSFIVASFVGAWLGAMFAPLGSKRAGAVFGVGVWAAALILSMVLWSPFLSSGLVAIVQAMTNANLLGGGAAPAIDPSQLQQTVDAGAWTAFWFFATEALCIAAAIAGGIAGHAGRDYPLHVGAGRDELADRGILREPARGYPVDREPVVTRTPGGRIERPEDHDVY